MPFSWAIYYTEALYAISAELDNILVPVLMLSHLS